MNYINSFFDIFEELIYSVTVNTNPGTNEGALYTKPYIEYLSDNGIDAHLQGNQKNRFRALKEFTENAYDEAYESLEESGENVPSHEDLSIAKNIPEELKNQDINTMFYNIVATLITLDFRSGNYAHAVEASSAAAEVETDIIVLVVEKIRESDFKDYFSDVVGMLVGILLDVEDTNRIKTSYVDIRKR